MSEKTNPEELHRELSPEEYKKLRIAAQRELKEEIQFLKTEEEYQRLMAEIETHKARRLQAIVLQYQMQNPSPESKPMNKAEVSEHPLAQSKPFGEATEPQLKKSRSLKQE